MGLSNLVNIYTDILFLMGNHLKDFVQRGSVLLDKAFKIDRYGKTDSRLTLQKDF